MDFNSLPGPGREHRLLDFAVMDTFTHALSGALLARATEPAAPRPDQLPRRTRMWIGFWAAAFPDSDFIVRFIDPLTYLTTHRGVTHSVVMLPLWALVLAVVFMWILRKQYSWHAFAGVIALGIGVHIVGDVITAFGTMIFAPFSDWRAQLPVTFILDPYFTGILIAGLIAAAVWKDTRRPAVIGLAVLASYVGFQGVLHQRAVAVGEAYAHGLNLKDAAVSAVPQPFSPFHWMVVVEQGNNYHLGYVSLMRREASDALPDDAYWLRRVNASYLPTDKAVWSRIPRYGQTPAEATLAEKVWHSDAFARFRRFALFPAVYRVDTGPEKTCVWFSDLRFALVGRAMPFRYGACQGTADTAWKVFRLSNDDNGREILDAIRVEG
ncbi:MAG TPA: metal-dependent hydrolase [Burkholderiales bacterium]|nr:metal-dependent hydrolase [Burkholderiales bacterium]